MSVSSDNEVCVKSAQKFLKIPVNPVISVQVKEGSVVLTRKNNEPKVRAWHGLYRALIQNAVTGVSKGWTKTLIFKGVGYKANVAGANLEMNLGLFPSDQSAGTGGFGGEGGKDQYYSVRRGPRSGGGNSAPRSEV